MFAVQLLMYVHFSFKNLIMKTKFLIFSLLATFAMTNVFATEGNSEKQVAEEIHQQKVDQKVTPKSSNYIMFDNQTGEGNQRTMQVNFVTMNMTFAVAASDAARALQLGDYKNYVWKNSKGEVLDFDKQCTSQGVYHGSTVTVYK